MPTAEQRFHAKVVMGPNGCWVWTGTSCRGYGHFSVTTDGRERSPKAHRWSWESANGPIPEGLQIDHLCRNTRCVNPDHMEAVTPGENSRRHARTITHCPAGHEHGEINTYVNAGKRQCRACDRDRKAAKRRWAERSTP